MTQTTDYLIIGAGIVGLTVARELQRRDPSAKVTVIDKEPKLGMHASGCNSGVLHSGIYYPADTLKARFTREGNQVWQAYCEEKNIPIDRCGKLIVARNGKEYEQLQTLEQRGIANGVEVQRLDLQQTRELEPRAKTFKEAQRCLCHRRRQPTPCNCWRLSTKTLFKRAACSSWILLIAERKPEIWC